jgi:hypothetical protein
VVAEVASWTGGCDLVKYARLPATRDEALSSLAQAIAIVEKARPVPVAVSPASSPETPPSPPQPPPREVRSAG